MSTGHFSVKSDMQFVAIYEWELCIRYAIDLAVHCFPFRQCNGDLKGVRLLFQGHPAPLTFCKLPICLEHPFCKSRYNGKLGITLYKCCTKWEYLKKAEIHVGCFTDLTLGPDWIMLATGMLSEMIPFPSIMPKPQSTTGIGAINQSISKILVKCSWGPQNQVVNTSCSMVGRNRILWGEMWQLPYSGMFSPSYKL